MTKEPTAWQEAYQETAPPDNDNGPAPPPDPYSMDFSSVEFDAKPPDYSPETEEPPAESPDPLELGLLDSGESLTESPEPTTLDPQPLPYDHTFKCKVLKLILEGQLDPGYAYFIHAGADPKLKSPIEQLAQIVDRFFRDHPADERPTPDTLDILISEQKMLPATRHQLETEWQYMQATDVTDKRKRVRKRVKSTFVH